METRRRIPLKKKLFFALIVSALIVLLCGAALAGSSGLTCYSCGDTEAGWTSWEYAGGNTHSQVCKNCYSGKNIKYCNPVVVTAAKEPTCTEDGNTEKIACSVCGHVTQEAQTIPAVGHTRGPAATCTSAQTCTECGKVLQTPIAHTPGAAATCTKPQTCTECGKVLQVPLGHTPGAEATCTTAQTCARCEYVYQQALEHSPGAEATCTEDQTCTRCGEMLAPATGHDYKAIKKVAATCTEDGYTVFECASCKDSYRDEYIDHLMHWFKLWNATEDGMHSAECKREDCEFIGRNACTAWEVTSGESILTVCPVCGRFNAENFEAIAEATIEGPHAINDEIIVRGMKAPFDGVLYAFTAGYEYSGRMQPFTKASKISLPLDSAEYAGFKLVRVDVTPASETAERAEAWTEITYSFENGILSFESECEGLFLLISTDAQA